MLILRRHAKRRKKERDDKHIVQAQRFFDHIAREKQNRGCRPIPLGARILKAALDFDRLEARGAARTTVLDAMRRSTGWYDPAVLAALESVLPAQPTYVRKVVSMAGLDRGMILADNVRGANGALLAGKGQEITETLLHRLRNVAQQSKLSELMAVFTAHGV